MTNQTNEELREEIANICRTGNYGIAETKVVNKLYDIAQSHANKAISDVLDRLETGERFAVYPLRKSKASVLEPTHEISIPLSAIQQERNKLKEGE